MKEDVEKEEEEKKEKEEMKDEEYKKEEETGVGGRWIMKRQQLIAEAAGRA